MVLEVEDSLVASAGEEEAFVPLELPAPAVPLAPAPVPLAFVDDETEAEGDALEELLPETEAPADAAGEGLALGLIAPFAPAGETLADAFGEALTLAEALGAALALGAAVAIGDMLALADGIADAAVAGVTEAVVEEAPVCDEYPRCPPPLLMPMLMPTAGCTP